jgi:hypothetical protein
MTYCFLRHLRRGELAEFVINQRQSSLGGGWIDLLEAIEEARDFASRLEIRTAHFECQNRISSGCFIWSSSGRSAFRSEQAASA